MLSRGQTKRLQSELELFFPTGVLYKASNGLGRVDSLTLPVHVTVLANGRVKNHKNLYADSEGQRVTKDSLILGVYLDGYHKFGSQLRERFDPKLVVNRADLDQINEAFLAEVDRLADILNNNDNTE